MDGLKIIAPVVGACALIVALILAKWISGQSTGNARMTEISGFIHEGAMAFLGREYRTMVVVVVVLTVVLGFALSWVTAVLYIFGALFSVLAGYFGMQVATKGNVRTAAAAENGGMNKALKVAFRSGAVMGLCVVGLGILGVGLAFMLLDTETALISCSNFPDVVLESSQR